MKLYLKQRAFAWTDSFYVYDENEQPVYEAKADMWALTHRIRLYQNGEEVAVVHQKLSWLMNRIELWIRGELVATLIQKMRFFGSSYSLDAYDWQIEGNIGSYEYVVSDGCHNVIMQIHRKLFSFTDSYCLEINHDENELICLLIAIAIDAANCHN